MGYRIVFSVPACSEPPEKNNEALWGHGSGESGGAAASAAGGKAKNN